MRWLTIIGLIAVCGWDVTASAQAPLELSVGYPVPTSGELQSFWASGVAFELRLPLRAGSRDHLSLDLGGQLFTTTSRNFGSSLRGLRALVSEHLLFPAADGRWQGFVGLGVQVLWTGKEKPQPLYPPPGSGPVAGGTVTREGWGPAGTVGIGWNVVKGPGSRLQLQGSWSLARIEGRSESYGVLGLAFLWGH